MKTMNYMKTTLLLGVLTGLLVLLGNLSAARMERFYF